MVYVVDFRYGAKPRAAVSVQNQRGRRARWYNSRTKWLPLVARKGVHTRRMEEGTLKTRVVLEAIAAHQYICSSKILHCKYTRQIIETSELLLLEKTTCIPARNPGTVCFLLKFSSPTLELDAAIRRERAAFPGANDPGEHDDDGGAKNKCAPRREKSLETLHTVEHVS